MKPVVEHQLIYLHNSSIYIQLVINILHFFPLKKENNIHINIFLGISGGGYYGSI